MLSSFSRHFAFSLLIVSFILPYALVAHTYPVPTFYAEFCALAFYLLLGAAVLLITLTSPSGAPPAGLLALPAVVWVPFAFGLWLVVQTFVLLLLEPSMNWLGAGCLLAACVATYAGYGFARARLAGETMRWIAWALVAGGLFAVFCQVVQLLELVRITCTFPHGLDCALDKFVQMLLRITHIVPLVLNYDAAMQRRPFGNMAQANHLATYISFAMAAALYLVQTRRLNVFLWGVLCALYALGLALTVSRGPWLQTMVIVGAGFWMAHARGRARRQTWHASQASVLFELPESTDDGERPDAPSGAWRAWLVPVVLMVILVVMNALVRWANLRWHLNLADSAAERFHEAGQIAPRLALWRYGLAMFRSHPWFGVGWGEFPHYQYEFVRTLGGVEIANNAHNILIDLLAKTGIIGCALVVIGLIAWFVRVLRAPRTSVQLFGFAMIGVLLVHALVEYPQQYLFFLLPAAFVFGLLEPRALRFVTPRVSTFICAVVICAGLVALYPVFGDYRRAEVLYYGSHTQERYRAAPSLLFGAWDDYGLATMMPVSADDLPAKLAAYKRAMALLPGEIVLRRYAALQVLNGDTADALDTVARLKIFSTELNDWPEQLASLHELCKSDPALAAFDAQLFRLYDSEPTGSRRASDDEGGDDGTSRSRVRRSVMESR